MASKQLEEARKAYQAKLKSGEIEVQRLDPIEKSKANPGSMKLAIRAHCYDCVGRDTGYISDIRNCEIIECALHRFRPYQSKS